MLSISNGSIEEDLVNTASSNSISNACLRSITASKEFVLSMTIGEEPYDDGDDDQENL